MASRAKFGVPPGAEWAGAAWAGAAGRWYGATWGVVRGAVVIGMVAGAAWVRVAVTAPVVGGAISRGRRQWAQTRKFVALSPPQ
ncbi:hypothetical protein [Paractinoplanes durhamensis]|uniref:hypothetical protein n=1 Tax=Paractinoplanes durhamensis TaxID=113563 RepID=UPI0036334FD6